MRLGEVILVRREKGEKNTVTFRLQELFAMLQNIKMNKRGGLEGILKSSTASSIAIYKGRYL